MRTQDLCSTVLGQAAGAVAIKELSGWAVGFTNHDLVLVAKRNELRRVAAIAGRPEEVVGTLPVELVRAFARIVARVRSVEGVIGCVELEMREAVRVDGGWGEQLDLPDVCKEGPK